MLNWRIWKLKLFPCLWKADSIGSSAISTVLTDVARSVNPLMVSGSWCLYQFHFFGSLKKFGDAVTATSAAPERTTDVVLPVIV